ncbi:hypothetical protein ACFOWM_09535 [Ferruginibacter yonginensis]|uniref:Uncharacterized protein n=1 Tax=Ferruginibacter yonginensis TaxID=1310416 RepID=A0ABV8QS90_9BACT
MMVLSACPFGGILFTPSMAMLSAFHVKQKAASFGESTLVCAKD